MVPSVAAVDQAPVMAGMAGIAFYHINIRDTRLCQQRLSCRKENKAVSLALGKALMGAVGPAVLIRCADVADIISAPVIDSSCLFFQCHIICGNLCKNFICFCV